MESTTGYLQAKPVPAADHGAVSAGADLISGLGDDVLLRILGLLPDVTQVVRTAVLSRRWRGLWARVPALHFDLGPEFQSPSDAEPFIAIVNYVIVPRAQPAESGIERLGIKMKLYYERGKPYIAAATVEAIEGWVWYAMQHGLTSFAFEVHVIPKKWLHLYCNEEDDGHEDVVEEEEEEEDNDYSSDEEEEEEEKDADEEESEEDEEEEEEEEEEDEEDDDEEESDEGYDEKETPVIALDELPSSAKLETLHLCLGRAGVRLSSTSAIFTSLTDLTLLQLKITADSDDNLSRFLSPACCPHLQKLRLGAVIFEHARSKELVLETSTLLELAMCSMWKMESLELRAPNLRVLEVVCCNHLERITMSAVRLEQLTFSHNVLEGAIHVDLPCVQRLEIDLVSYMPCDTKINDASISLLKSCGSATCLVVDLEVPWVSVSHSFHY
ncbi:unnamed protein product [Urochloa humidicola]